jgi:ABC-type transport system involved in multi-copper enzyme maturation permease subunit
VRFAKIVRFEITWQLRRRSTRLYFAIVLAFAFVLATKAFVNGARNGGYFVNAPFVVAAVTVIAGMLALFVIAAVAGDAATRDLQTRMAPLVYTTPVGRFAYLGGRFFGAFGISALLMGVVQFGLMFAAQIPSELNGPFRFAAYRDSFCLFALPNAFVATALLFSVAVLSRRTLVTYFGATFLVLASIFGTFVVAKQFHHWTLAKQLDPFGFTVLAELSRAWTPLQKNARLIPLEGSLLWNRLLWLAIAIGALALTYLRFHPSPSGRRCREAADEGERGFAKPLTRPSATLSRRERDFSRWRQILVVTSRSFREIVTSRGAILIAVMTALLVLTAPAFMQHLGTPLFPTTARMATILGGSDDLFGLVVPLFTIFYAGELLWREREARMHVIADAAPVPDYVPLLGKLLGLSVALVAFQALVMISGLVAQFAAGYKHFELGLYLQILFGLQLPNYLLFAVLAFAIHVVVNQKYVGHVISILAYAFTAFAPALGIEHKLLIYGSDPGWQYSDMRGFGASVGPFVAFKLYWACWALLLLVVAKLLWVRGTSQRRLTRSAAWKLAGASGFLLIAGGSILPNTILRAAQTEIPTNGRQLTGVALRVELYPELGEVFIHGNYRFTVGAVNYQRRARLNDEWLPRVGSGRERIAFDAVIGTDANQIATAPGTLRRTWMENGRRYFHYVAEAPIRNSYAIESEHYAVREGRWNNVAIQILHHPSHVANVDRMMRSAQASLGYYSEQFGRYPYREIRLVETPGPEISLHSDPINIRYFEGFSEMNPNDDVDFPFAVVAHEVAHQWWGNQLTPAPVDGAPVLTESLAWYSAMGVIERSYGADHLRRFLDVLREAYLSPRARAGVPLLHANDRFVAYRKGPFAMYALREYLGEERVNLALRRLFAKHGAGRAPLPTALDLYAELQAVTPPSLRELLADLFEVNTFWDLSTRTANAEEIGGGAWRVTLNVSALKVAVDDAGTERQRQMNDLIEIGVFGSDGKPLYLQQHRIHSGQERITVVVPGKPARAGIDPRNLLIDTEWRDNVIDLTR